MKHGFIKTAAFSPALRVADCRFNTSQILDACSGAASSGVRLAAFPELSITGYTCGDLFFHAPLLDSACQSLLWLAGQTSGLDMIIIVGLPLSYCGRLYNCAAVMHKGEILGIIPKTAIPNFGEFYEARYFASAAEVPAESTVRLGGRAIPFGQGQVFSCGQSPDFSFGVEICQDLWQPVPPSAALCAAGANIIVNLSASDEAANKAAFRRQLVSVHSSKCLCGYIYASAGPDESTTDLVFGGHCLLAECGDILAQAAPFSSAPAVAEIDVSRIGFLRRQQASDAPPRATRVLFDMSPADAALTRSYNPNPFIPQDEQERRQCCQTTLDIQARGLKKRLAHTGAKAVTIGISGGLDSTLALLVCVKAFALTGLDISGIHCITMPCFGTTELTKSNAYRLCQALGVPLDEINITDAVLQHFKDIGHSPDIHDVTFENSQARERTQVLMDMANRKNALVVGTGDLSELALGWATYNGDHMSMYGVNSGVPKTLIRHVLAHYAESCGDARLRQVLCDIIDTPVSPELLPAQDGRISQKTEDIVGPYQLHDFFLYHAIGQGCGPQKLYRMALYTFDGVYDSAVILKWLRTFFRRFFSQQFKRSCLPDGPRIGSLSLSPRGDLRMPSDASAQAWLAQLDQLAAQ